MEQLEDDGDILLICQSDANPTQVTFEWNKGGNVTLEDNIEHDGLVSNIRLEATQSSFGTYYCYVNNSKGQGVCEIDVQGNE